MGIYLPDLFGQKCIGTKHVCFNSFNHEFQALVVCCSKLFGTIFFQDVKLFEAISLLLCIFVAKISHTLKHRTTCHICHIGVAIPSGFYDCDTVSTLHLQKPGHFLCMRGRPSLGRCYELTLAPKDNPKSARILGFQVGGWPVFIECHFSTCLVWPTPSRGIPLWFLRPPPDRVLPAGWHANGGANGAELLGVITGSTTFAWDQPVDQVGASQLVLPPGLKRWNWGHLRRQKLCHLGFPLLRFHPSSLLHFLPCAARWKMGNSFVPGT